MDEKSGGYLEYWLMGGALIAVVIFILFFWGFDITTTIPKPLNSIAPDPVIDQLVNNLSTEPSETSLTASTEVNIKPNSDVKIKPIIITSTTNQKTMPIVKITTNQGVITLELFADDAPKTVANFVTLAQKGFYDGVIFHRVISGFMIQGGDPTGTGMGGPGYKFADELDPSTPSYQRGYVRGTVAMANAGPNTNGSQFFIMHKDYSLPNAYTIFGRVTAGMEVVDAIATSEVDGSDRPVIEVTMKKVEVVK